MDKAPQVSLHSTAHYFLEGLNELGIEYLFCNLGTDHAPLIEEMARWRSEGRKLPATLLCPHENTAMHMAAGYAMVTGRGQAVLVHVDAGTSNAAMAAHNICRDRVPLLLMAGKAPYTVRGELPGSRDTYVHFIQEPFDQGAIVRNYVKWEWTLPSGVITKEVLRRAHTVAHSDPQGPVYLMLPRETLAQTWDAAAVRSFPEERYGAVRAGAADAAAIAALAERLLAAKHPILITSYAGRNSRAPGLIEELARFAGIRVFEFNPCLPQHLARFALLGRADAGQARRREPTSACWWTWTCRGSRATPARIRRRGGRTSTSTWSRSASRSGAFRRTCACLATAS